MSDAPTLVQLEQILQAFPCPMFWKDRSGVYLGCNDPFARDAGVTSPSEVIGRLDSDLPWASIAEKLREEDRGIVEDHREIVNLETSRPGADGRPEWIRKTKMALTDGNGGVIGVFGYYEYITEYREARESVSESEARYRTLVEQATDGIVLTTADGVFIDANPAATKMVGYSSEELRRMRFVELIEPRSLEKNPPRYDELYGGEAVTNERILVHKDGSTLPVEMSARQLPDGNLLGFIRDISERKAAQRKQQVLETQLRQAQKMEALGTLAGGIAHDFNNILLVIAGYGELLQHALDQDDQHSADVEQIMRAADRGRRLVQRILAFSRPASHNMEPIAIVRALGDILPLLRSSLPDDVDLEVELPESESFVLAEEALVQQVLLNLVTNAAHAMPGGGTVRVALQEREFHHPVGHVGGQLDSGRYVVLQVGDAGVGMDDEMLRRVFEPFFTTKTPDRGSGLGLSIVHGVVGEMGGGVAVESEVGVGSTFTVYLPTTDAAVEQPIAPETKKRPDRAIRVLLVDDEPALVDINQRRLESIGFSVATFTDPRTALVALSEDAQSVDVVVTDWNMPPMNGAEFVRRARMVRPDLRAVLITGFRADSSDDAGDGVVDYVLNKPFTGQQLADAIERALA